MHISQNRRKHEYFCLPLIDWILLIDSCFSLKECMTVISFVVHNIERPIYIIFLLYTFCEYTLYIVHSLEYFLLDFTRAPKAFDRHHLRLKRWSCFAAKRTTAQFGQKWKYMYAYSNSITNNGRSWSPSYRIKIRRRGKHLCRCNSSVVFSCMYSPIWAHFILPYFIISILPS